MKEKKNAKNAKKKYNPPHLIKYGSFKKLTLGTRTRANDLGSASVANKTRSGTS